MSAVIVWEPPRDFAAEAEQRQILAWIAAGIPLCPFVAAPCDCRHLPKHQRCI